MLFGGYDNLKLNGGFYMQGFSESILEDNYNLILSLSKNGPVNVYVWSVEMFLSLDDHRIKNDTKLYSFLIIIFFYFFLTNI